MDAWHARLNVPGQVEAIKQEARRWNAAVIVETTGYQQSLAQFLHLQEPWLCVHSFKPRVSKQMRLERVTPHLTGGQVVFAEALNPVELARPERGDLVSELLDFPVGRHDDMVDAFSQGVIWIGERFLGKPQGNEINVRIIGGNLRNEDDELRHGSGREHIATYYFNPFRQ
jgi:predicted phage terminase large subunit-like protein